MEISAVVCTYKGDNENELGESLRSLTNQTRLPEEIVIVEDGPLTSEIDTTLSEFETSTDTTVQRVQHSENRGHGAARRTGIIAANHDFVAIHDADDLAVPERLELSIEELSNTGADLVGGYIEEFVDDPNKPHAVREVPCDPSNIRRVAKFRSPVNHTTVLARREAILESGNYRQVGQMEDYELWARMLANGYTLVNIPQVLARVRAGEDMYERRGGLNYVCEEFRLQRHLADIGFVSRPRAGANFIIRSIPKIIPSPARKKVYEVLYRTSPDSSSFS